KSTIEDSFDDLWVKGEVSGYIHHSSGHHYLSLKDDKAVIKVTIWRSVGNQLKFEPENGQEVMIYGNVTVYEKGGNYQLNCRKIIPVGVGELELAFRQLHEKLSKEGLFDDERKKEIPTYAKKIGVVTSPTGAAVRDIINVARRRNNSVEMVIYPSQVQGDGAENSIAAGIEYFNSREDIDLIITGRGGGSLEDLWCFNTEIAVRAIADSQIPVISAVGHEVDTTLTDFAADLRAATPSAAAELAVWSKDEFLENITDNVKRQTYLLENMVEDARDYLISFMERPVFARPMEIIYHKQQYLDNLSRILISSGKNSFDKLQNRLSLAVSKLDALSPLKILARGYSVTRKLPENVVIKTTEQINSGDTIETILTDGRLISQIREKKKD
ncbi:exodeoxyribonuclease VII large subunit, partial [Candidatus Zixiibacteriota bacterium]